MDNKSSTLVFFDDGDHLVTAYIEPPRPKGRGGSIDSHPVRVLYDSADDFKERSQGLPWPLPVSITPDAPDVVLKQKLEELTHKIQAVTQEREAVTQERDNLQWELDNIRPAYIAMENEMKTWKSRDHHSVQRIDENQQMSASSDMIIDWMSTLTIRAEQRLKDAWSPSFWASLKPHMRQAIVQPVVMSYMIREADPFGDESYEWAAFLLARNTERLLNDVVIRRLFDWLETQYLSFANDFPNVFVDNTRIIARNKIIWKVPIVCWQGSVSYQDALVITWNPRLSLDQITKLFWNIPSTTERPSEWQDIIAQFQTQHHLEWMQEREIYRELNVFRRTIRNTGAHRLSKVLENDYLKWQTVLLGPLDSLSMSMTTPDGDSPISGWWRNWIQQCLIKKNISIRQPR